MALQLPLQPITEPQEIIEHLQTLVKLQIRLTATFPPDKEEFLTQLLRVAADEVEPYILLDALTPGWGQLLAARKTSLALEYKLYGEPYEFSAHILGVKRDPFPSVRLGIPERIQPRQARRFFRVEPFIHEPVEILRLDLPEAEANEAENLGDYIVVDISMGGIAFNTNVPRSYLSPGTLVPHLELRLPTGETISCQLILRTVRHNRSGAFRWRCGAEFFMIKPEDQERINRYIIGKQRIDIKRIKRELE